MKKMIIAMLVLALAGSTALADVVTTASVKLREGPTLNDTVLDYVEAGEHMEFLGAASVDDRGVAWYHVKRGNVECWVSSRYSELVDEKIGNGVELADYYHRDLVLSALELGAADYECTETEVPNRYSCGAVAVAGFDTVEYIGITGKGYTLFGAEVGMDAETASEMLAAGGLILTQTSDTEILFRHPAGEDAAFADEEGFDSSVILFLDEDGSVKGFDWSTYTG